MRINKIKKLLIAVIFCTAVLLSGCKPKQSILQDFKYDPESTDYNMSGSVSLWWGSLDYMKQSLGRSIARFNAKFPNIEVNVSYQPHSDYYDALNFAYMSNTAPDVIRMDHVYLQALGEAKRVYDLNALTDGKAAALDKPSFLSAGWDGVSIANKQYGYPFDCNTTLLMYNERICKEVFGDGYLPPETYEQLKSQSLAVYQYQKNGTKPYKGLVMAIDASGSQHDIYVFNGWLARYGASILNSEHTGATLNTPQAVEAFTKLYELAESGAMQYTGYSPYLEQEFLRNGTTAFIELGSWVYDTIKLLDMDGDGKSDIKISPMPVLKEGIEGYATLGLFGLGITSQCKRENLPAAYEFIRFMATDYDSHLDYAVSTRTMPSLLAAQGDIYYESGEDAEFWEMFKYQLALSLPRPGTSLWPEVVTEIKTAERNLMAGGRYTPQLVADEATSKINSVFADLKG